MRRATQSMRRATQSMRRAQLMAARLHAPTRGPITVSSGRAIGGAYVSARRLVTGASSRVKVEKQAGVVKVTLTRPDKMNALDMDMFRSLRDAARSLVDNPAGVRAVVLSGEGRAFCAGLDVRSVCHPLSATANMRELLHRPEGELSNLAQDVGYLWRRLPAPVIAAVHGICFGGGLQIALGADIRVVAPTCKLSVMEAKWGLVPDMSATVTLPELVPKDVAMELTMTGRVFDGREALGLGLATKLSQTPQEEALVLAQTIAQKSPDATAAAKRLLHATYSEASNDARNLRLESELQTRLIGGWNQAACAARGLGLPPFLRPSFKERAAQWSEEADSQAELEIRAMLDGAVGDAPAATGNAALASPSA